MKTNSAIADRYAPRLIALANCCPEGMQLKAAEGPRRAECRRKKSVVDISLKIMLRDDTLGELVLYATARIETTPECTQLELLSASGRKPSNFFTERQEKFLSGLLTWAESALSAAIPTTTQSKATATPLKKDCIALYAILSGCPPATTRKRLNERFFSDHEESRPAESILALIDLLRDEDAIALFDWKEDERLELIKDMAKKRGVRIPTTGKTPQPPQAELEALRAALTQAGLSLVAIDSGMDADLIGIAAKNDIAPLANLLAQADLRLTGDIDPRLYEDD